MISELSSSFEFLLKTKVVFGKGKSDDLGKELFEGNYHRVAVIIDRNVAEDPHAKKVVQDIQGSGPVVRLIMNLLVEPTYDELDSFFVRHFKGSDFDLIIAIGGGSTLDLGKGLAVLATNPGPAIQYRGFPKLSHKPLPVIALPTTAGTGSEVTYNAVFTDAHEKKKLGINSRDNFPILAVVDPLLTLHCPRQATLSAGADALVHTFESFVHRKHTPLSRLFSKEAFRLIFNSLGVVLREPENVGARGNVALGASLAAMALMNSGSGPSGALSYPLGVHFHVPHGLAGAVFLPEVTRFNIQAGYQDYAELYDLTDGSDRSLPDQEKAVILGEKLDALWREAGLPASLSAFGVSSAQATILVDQYDMLRAGIDQNPIPMTKDDISKMVNTLLREK
jgi:alcohol dehydrogenase class IV